MSEDIEIELLKHRALRKMMSQQAAKERAQPSAEAEDPRSVVASRLVGRGLEVLEAAEEQYPQVAAAVVRELARLIKQGKVEGPITGEELYALFLSLGLRVRLPTRIYYEKRGERKGLGELIRERLSGAES